MSATHEAEIAAIYNELAGMQTTYNTQLLSACMLEHAGYLFRLLKAAGIETDESLARIADNWKASLLKPEQMPTIVDTSSNMTVRQQ